ncbi:helix-turn-helix domain-containing protein [Microvirga sp. BT290]|uniref:Helix-turn-helix domain-containing protein n=2 Tax=Microvirga terrestris TaxID=2791024 RepID=A0ABS0HVN8_9HYPH|nr:helix-turn-helix domain-containing protein [Microvirga terrestris]
MRAIKLTLEESEKSLLVAALGSGGPEELKVRRAGIVLRSAAGLTDNEVAAEFQVSVHTVSKWRRRYQEAGIEGLTDWPRSGKPRRLEHETIAIQISEVMGDIPPGGGQWSVRKVAATLGLSRATTGRIWRDLQKKHSAQTRGYQATPVSSGRMHTTSAGTAFTQITSGV